MVEADGVDSMLADARALADTSPLPGCLFAQWYANPKLSRTGEVLSTSYCCEPAFAERGGLYRASESWLLLEFHHSHQSAESASTNWFSTPQDVLKWYVLR
jgi:hypothetical protein